MPGAPFVIVVWWVGWELILSMVAMPVMLCLAGYMAGWTGDRREEGEWEKGLSS